MAAVLVLRSRFLLRLGLTSIMCVSFVICSIAASVLCADKTLKCILFTEFPSSNWACWQNTDELFSSSSFRKCSPKLYAVPAMYIDKSNESLRCLMCSSKNETVSYIVSECSKLAPKHDTMRHDNEVKFVHWRLCEKYRLDRARKRKGTNMMKKIHWEQWL